MNGALRAAAAARLPTPLRIVLRETDALSDWRDAEVDLLADMLFSFGKNCAAPYSRNQHAK